MKKTYKVKPCKCGDHNRLILRSFDGRQWWVKCTACNTSSRAELSKAQAVETWNKGV